ncbi:hypothetical protein [Vannielia litorea]|uniref:Uncharacterized protein n=1 Tax=Vannielia litorea TaxID=1217970 RepID=A0A1N6G4U3_9RHOB|nr:hypothetical protein [Vannielia litorea]SIO02566.1 hypothetical protein SAMN05444002_2207 [Vannielia litorea]
MSMVRLDTQGQSSQAYALPAQVLAARHRQNSVAPQATDIRPPEKPEATARPGLDTARDEVVGRDGERRPPPPLKEYARIPTAMTAEILRLQEEALEKAREATEAEGQAQSARADAAQAEKAEEAARAAEARADPTEATPAEGPATARAPSGFATGLPAVNAPATGPSQLDHQA